MGRKPKKKKPEKEMTEVKNVFQAENRPPESGVLCSKKLNSD